MTEQSKTCPFDKLRAGSELGRRIENPKSKIVRIPPNVLVRAERVIR